MIFKLTLEEKSRTRKLHWENNKVKETWNLSLEIILKIRLLGKTMSKNIVDETR